MTEELLYALKGIHSAQKDCLRKSDKVVNLIFSGRVPTLSLCHLAEDDSNLKNYVERKYATQHYYLMYVHNY